jgi:hypothetical protein
LKVDVFNKIANSIFFEARFKAALKSADMHMLLEGNRVAAMHGLSASLGKEYDIYALRELYDQLMPQAIYYGKKNGQQPDHVAIYFLCNLFDAYLEKNPDTDPLIFATYVNWANMVAQLKLPLKWEKIIQQSSENYRHEQDELNSRLPELVEARNYGKERYQQNILVLSQEGLPSEALDVWDALSLDFKTEYEIHKNSGIPLDQILEWLIPFQSTGLVVAIGTGNKEPQYRRTPIDPNSKEAIELKRKLDGQKK